ncbi:hypothetical protein CGCSCA5_v014149 [Colletotrichum siamense]|nr:hypothetical protein CGCSCA5_v014149 [Colletotrichum siamense]KAF4872344.1 hypothetical protein CGCSCA1_v008550 [Colletotrichum siamense]
MRVPSGIGPTAAERHPSGWKLRIYTSIASDKKLQEACLPKVRRGSGDSIILHGTVHDDRSTTTKAVDHRDREAELRAEIRVG